MTNARSVMFGFAAILLTLAGCAGSPAKPPCGAGYLDLVGCPPAVAIDDPVIAEREQKRRWHKASDLGFDPIELGLATSAEVMNAQMRIIGSSYEESLRSLAAKIWLIDHAQHTIDVAYYIFKRDLVGYSILGALCEAVQRGVDVRVMVDSLGSIHMTHSELKALENCAIDAGFMRNDAGEITTTQANAQVVVFNAISKVFVNYNRRSHDKLLVVDGAYADQAWAMTGGRNISLAYYGLNPDGSKDPTAYKDLEILVRPPLDAYPDASISQLSEHYFSVLFSHKRNKRLSSNMAYTGQRKKFVESLSELRAIPDFSAAYVAMPEYLDELAVGKVRLAHELQNLVSTNVVDAYDENVQQNPNSILWLMAKLDEAVGTRGVIRIVSPYFFVPRYERKDGTVYHDGQVALRQWLNQHPENRIEIITNSVLTSDNFFAQAIIDMDTAPRLLLNPQLEEQWNDKKLERSEFNQDLVASPLWQQMVSNPRIKIYQTGRTDSVLIGGDTDYGKLHAKFILSDHDIGFVGTSNFDYRSRLYNNEMGYFFQSAELSADLIEEFEALKAQSYLWGSPEWLGMRALVMEQGGEKGKWTKKQRKTFRKLRKSGLHWQF